MGIGILVGFLLGGLLELLGADALASEFEDDGVMDEAVDRRSGGHWILEDAIPFCKRQVAGDEERPSLIPLCHEGKEDLHLFGALLDISDIIQDQELVVVESLEGFGEGEVPFGGEEVLNQAEGGSEENGVATLYQGVTDGCGDVALASTGEAEAQDIGGFVEEATGGNLTELEGEFAREALFLEGGEGFAWRQLRGAQQSLTTTLGALVALSLHDLEQSHEGVTMSSIDEPCDELIGHRGQLESQEELSDVVDCRRRQVGAGHASPPAQSRRRSYSARSGWGMWTSGTTVFSGAARALTVA